MLSEVPGAVRRIGTEAGMACGRSAAWGDVQLCQVKGVLELEGGDAGGTSLLPLTCARVAKWQSMLCLFYRNLKA